MPRESSIPAISIGLLAAFVGYAASFAIVLAGLKAVRADDGQAATGLFFATIGMGICSIWLPAVTRIPAAVAWSTPGAAFLAATTTLPGGFAEAVGALIFCAGLIVLTGLIPALGKIRSMVRQSGQMLNRLGDLVCFKSLATTFTQQIHRVHSTPMTH